MALLRADQHSFSWDQLEGEVVKKEDNEFGIGRQKGVSNPRFKMSLFTGKRWLNKSGILYPFAKPSHSILNVTANVWKVIYRLVAISDSINLFPALRCHCSFLMNLPGQFLALGARVSIACSSSRMFPGDNSNTSTVWSFSVHFICFVYNNKLFFNLEKKRGKNF